MEANAKQYFDENSTLIEDYFEELMPRNEVGAIDQNFLDDNSELLKFLEHGTLLAPRCIIYFLCFEADKISISGHNAEKVK